MKKVALYFLSVLVILSVLSLPLYGCSQQKEKGTVRLTFAETSLINSQNPLLMYGEYTGGIMGRIYETLTCSEDDGTLIPCLAKSWEYSKDTLTWTFHLQEEAKWSDGKPLTAEDVKFTMEKCKVVNSPNTADIWGYLDSITATDEHTVKFKLKESRGSFPTDMRYVWIAPKHLWENIQDKDLAANTNPKPVGSGPFLWKEFVDQSHVLLVKNENYWGKVPEIDELLIKKYGTAEAAALALKSGEVDAMRSITVQSMVASLLEESNLKIGLREPGHTNQLYLNLRFPPNNVVQFRQAIDAAIDKPGIISFAVAGYGKIPAMVPAAPVAEIVPEVAWKYTNKTQTERLAIANSMLDQLGYTKGSDGIRIGPSGRIAFEMFTTTTPSYVRTAEMIREIMKSIGIEITVKTSEVKVLANMLFSGTKTLAWQWCMFTTPNRGLDTWVSEWGNDPYNVFFNSATVGWTDEATQSLMRQARRATGDEAKSLYKQAQIKFADQMPIVGLWNDVIVYAYRTDRFANWVPVADYFGLLSNINLTGLKKV